MVANILPTDTPSTQGQKVKLYIFLKVVMLHIKLKRIAEHRAPWKANMLSLHTSMTPGVGSKILFFFFSKSCHVAYQIKVEAFSISFIL